ncbi:MAG TPA: glycosyltransferase family 2 protein [Xanthomonadaceae bacterium]|nr:glycosyltransferase family 2 protein [Xanthomonadaceae bacterium]
MSDISVIIPTHRDAGRAVSAADAIWTQALPEGCALQVIVVDDGSGDDSAERLAERMDPRVRLLLLPTNVGRSGARNAGAAIADGEFLVFMDCDCLPTGSGFLQAHLAAMRNGAVACTGDVLGAGGGFWDRYQREASLRRRRQHGAGMRYAGSSQNLAVRRDAFEASGGFDTGYRRYGFEDRDLLLRLSALGPIAWTDAAVRHLDRFDLAQVSRKMAEAGAWSSPRFAARHPDAYRALGFAALDARERRWLRPAARLLDRCLPSLAKRVDSLLEAAWIPYAARAAMTRLVTGLSYLAGTSRSLTGAD